MQNISKNLKAFLDTIATSEGTIDKGNNGYNVLVGSILHHPLLFSDYSDHPRILNHELDSTAAGRYQLLERYFDAYKKLLNLPDFSPDSQDKIAIQQIKECHALDDVENGDFNTAVILCAHIWASLPGAGYGQREYRIEDLREIYQKLGGTIA